VDLESFPLAKLYGWTELISKPTAPPPVLTQKPKQKGQRLIQRRNEWERTQIVRAIARTGSVAKAAESLGMKRPTLYSRCKKLGVTYRQQGGAWALHGV